MFRGFRETRSAKCARVLAVASGDARFESIRRTIVNIPAHARTHARTHGTRPAENAVHQSCGRAALGKRAYLIALFPFTRASSLPFPVHRRSPFTIYLLRTCVRTRVFTRGVGGRRASRRVTDTLLPPSRPRLLVFTQLPPSSRLYVVRAARTRVNVLGKFRGSARSCTKMSRS